MRQLRCLDNIVDIFEVGVKAVAVALTGTALPIVITIAVTTSFQHHGLLHDLKIRETTLSQHDTLWKVFGWNPDFSFKESLVAGTSLSSTAIGMAAKMMQVTLCI